MYEVGKVLRSGTKQRGFNPHTVLSNTSLGARLASILPIIGNDGPWKGELADTPFQKLSQGVVMSRRSASVVPLTALL